MSDAETVIAESGNPKQDAPGSLPDLRKMREWHTESARWKASWLPEAERLEGMIHAYQWTAEQEQELEKQGRKAMRSPHAAEVIWSMVGWRAQHKYEIKYLPRGGSDQGIAQARSMLAKFVWDENQAEYAVGDACLSQYIGPLGWIFVGIQQDDPSAEPIDIKNVPWREIGWDYRAKRPDLSDAKYMTRERWMALDDAQQLYPEHAEELAHLITTRKTSSQTTNEFGIDYTEQRAGDPVGPISSWGPEKYLYSAREEVRIVEMWYRQKERGHYITMPDGRCVVFDPKNCKHQMGILQGAMVRPGLIPKVYVATFCADLLLEHMLSPYQHGMFPYVPFWGLVDQKGIPYGITRLIEDEQTIINWTTSKLLWIAASRQAYVGPSADVEAVADQLAKPDGLVPRTSPGDVEIIPQGEMTALNSSLLQNALVSMKEISGNNDEMRGQQSNATSGKAVLARQDAALRQQGRFMDNEQRALVQIGEILASLMDQTYTDAKILRVTEANGKMGQSAINVTDPLQRHQMEQAGIKVFGPITQGQYDAVVSSTPLSTSQREAISEQMTNLMQGLDPRVRIAVLDLWFDMQDGLPNKDEWVQRIQQVQQSMAPQPPPPEKPSESLTWSGKDLPDYAKAFILNRDFGVPMPQGLTPGDMIPSETVAKHLSAMDQQAQAQQNQRAQTNAQQQAAQQAQAAQQQHEAQLQQQQQAHEANSAGNQHLMALQQAHQQHQQQMVQQQQAQQAASEMQASAPPRVSG